MTLEELRCAVVEGRVGARDELARELRSVTLAVLSRRFDADLAEDLTQHVLLKIFEKFDQFEPRHEDNAFEHWVKVIIARAARSQYARRQRAPVDLRYPGAVPSTSFGPSTWVRCRERLRVVAEVIEGLDTPLRRAAENQIVEGNIHAFAREWGIPVGTAHSRHWNVRQRFRADLSTPAS